MSDRILKESDVIREVESLLVSDEMRHLNDLEYGNNQALYHVIDRIEDLPSADRPQGKWVKHDDERDYCSRCKHIFKTRTITQQDKWTLYIDDLGYNYCPNCGAKMFAKDINVPNKPQTDCQWK